MFSGIGILGRLTKKHKHFWISCHLLPLNECFSKNDLHLIALLSGRENHQKTQNYHFLIFFDRFESNHHYSSVFNFVIFEEFSSLNKIIWENPWSGLDRKTQQILRGSLWIFHMMVARLGCRLRSWTLRKNWNQIWS